ncbi:atrial natriuretic peptide receptor 3-like [Anneissia japonica]|uniref:atrial natriuretic peptide receptor 3-like n=1 Tax=Anneissia japonica TaxID=1529436 RepID=UPI0014259B8B|nr:atrial natriuretic peptide receptor 3-like [Anneissia japonica]
MLCLGLLLTLLAVTEAQKAQCILPGNNENELRLLFMTTYNDVYPYKTPFKASLIRPSADIAWELVDRRGLLSGLSRNITWKDTQCHHVQPMIDTVEFHEQGGNAMFGPCCEYSAAPAIRLAGRWDIPVITVGALAPDFDDKQTEYKMLTRVESPYTRMGESLNAFFKLYDWKHIGLIIANDEKTNNPDIISRNFYFACGGVQKGLNKTGKNYEWIFKLIDNQDDVYKDAYAREVLSYISTRSRGKHYLRIY